MKSDIIKALVACPCSGFGEADVKVLEAFSEERLTALAATGAARKKLEDDLKAANAKVAEIEASLKAAQAAQIPAEELVQLRTLAEEKKQQDAVSHAALVASLKPLGKNTEEELKAMSLAQLTVLAGYAKVEPKPNFSGRGIPMQRSASTEDFTPPNAYDAGIKALQAKVN